ncbi:class-10 pathogenesis-related protein 1-like [Senna tora]|uniref:Class-10 pathogenesis-related protein 1-like n=1 Tax=Senna tora TaxID=362788 RepID=A0A834W7W2_9FABA|nr:class-10 pathogenesis-related protein 1-like [Senna tora]
MGVFTFNEESISAIAPARLFKALVFDGHVLIPKIINEIQCENIEGNGGPGELHYLMHKVEAIDKDNFVYEYSVVESDTFPATLEKISVQTKMVAAPSGGTVVKVTINYVTKGDAKPSEEQHKIGKARGEGLFKAIEGYLLANPDYN